LNVGIGYNAPGFSERLVRHNPELDLWCIDGRISIYCLGGGVGLGLAVGVGLGVVLGVTVGVELAVPVGVAVGVAVAVGVDVAVTVAVGVAVAVGVGVTVAVGVAVAVGVGVCVALGVTVAVGVGVGPPAFRNTEPAKPETQMLFEAGRAQTPVIPGSSATGKFCQVTPALVVRYRTELELLLMTPMV
jgi:hypothetical protein